MEKNFCDGLFASAFGPQTEPSAATRRLESHLHALSRFATALRREKACITPGLYWRNALGEVRPWTPSYDDLMANDWEIYSPRMGIGD